MIRLNTIDKMTDEFGKSLIGTHMHFTWHNKDDNTIETMPGKVLDCKDNKIIVDTMDIFMLDNNTSNDNNKMIRTFNRLSFHNPSIEIETLPFEIDEYLTVKISKEKTNYNNDLLEEAKNSIIGRK